MPLDLTIPAAFERTVTQDTGKLKIRTFYVDNEASYAQIQLKQRVSADPEVWEDLPETYRILDLAEETTVTINGQEHIIPASNYFTDACQAAPSGATVYEVNKNGFYGAFAAMYFPGTVT